MRNELLIYHRGLKGSENSPFLNEPGLARWTTCVRSLLLGPKGSVTGQQYDEVYRGTEATEFLTEIVAGLQSPMVGETEVHGQFKEFLTQIQSEVSHELFKELMSVHFLARKVRSNYLKNLGCQSYGSFARKKMREMDKLTILGSGKLAAEIVPWLVKNRSYVNLICRRPELAPEVFQNYENLFIRSYDVLPVETQGLIVTAPLSSQQIYQHFSESKPLVTLDFRAESRKDPLSMEMNSIALDDVFEEIERQRFQVQMQIDKARSFIKKSSLNLESAVGRHLRSIKVS